MSIKQIDTAVKDGLMVLLPHDSDPPLVEEEIPPRYSQFSLRHIRGCSLFGCNHQVLEGYRYCCMDHEELSYRLSHLGIAYVVVDDFFCIAERQSKCILALFKNSENVSVGIPRIVDSGIFMKVPWEWGHFIDLNLEEEETSRSWVFFHVSTSPKLGMFPYQDTKCSWSRKNRYEHFYLEEPLSSSISYLKEYSNDVDLHNRCQGWSLSEFTLRGQSLFCLTLASREQSLLKTVRGSEKSKGKMVDYKGKGKIGEDDAVLKKRTRDVNMDVGSSHST